MKNGERTWVVRDWELDISAPLVRVVVRAGTMQEALGKAFEAVFDDLGCSFEDLEAEQAPWLDGYEYLDGSGAAKEMRLHAQQACGKAGKAGGERQGLTMPIDTLADAMDWSQCDAAGDNGCRALDVASMALVDIAVSLRAMSGRPPVTDTPMQERMRAAMDKGEDPQSATEGMPYGMTSVRSYANAFKQACKPRTATDPSPSADSTGKQQEDGKESDLEHIGEKS